MPENALKIASFCEPVESEGTNLFTVVLLPYEEGKFPAIVYRTPYVDDCVGMSDEQICIKTMCEKY